MSTFPGLGVAALGVALALAQPALVAGAPLDLVVRGSLQKRALEGDPLFQYFLYVPTHAAADAPVFVTVHGISRNAREHAEQFAPLAERYGVVLVAPRFTRKRFPDYQRLGRANRGERADVKLAHVLDEVARVAGVDTRRLYLFGYSGGGQFVHRFAMAHPERVNGYVVGAAGWYTFPDPNERFPLGIASTPDLPDVHFEPDRFLRVPATVLVGERDRYPGTAMRKSAVVRKQQGETRFERGEQWVAAMNAAATAAKLPSHYRFESLSRSPHSFAKSVRRGDMASRVFECLFGGPPTPAAR